MSAAPARRGGRRVAERKARPPRPEKGPGAAVAGILLVLAAAAILATRPAPVSSTATGTTTGAVVSDSIAACPEPGGSPGSSSRVDFGSVRDPGLGSGGSVRQGTPGSAGSPLQLSRGHLVKVPSPPGKAPVVQAHGAAAAGLFGYRTDGGAGGGTLAVSPCAAPRAQWWFTGAGASLDHSSSLVLTNVDPGPAVVDVRVFGPHGEISTIGTRGITVGPGRRHTLNLAEVAPQTKDMAVSVQASRGRVVAAVDDRYRSHPGSAPGQEWLPPQPAPSKVVRLAGLPSNSGEQSLLIANPSNLEALVSVQIAGKNGSFAPAGLGDLQVPPDTILKTSVSGIVGKDPSAVRLQSRVPITASLRSVAGGDSAVAGAVQPLQGPAAVPVVPGAKNTLELSAGSVAAQADLTAYDAKGHQVQRSRLTVKAKTTVTWTPRKKAAYVVVKPRGGTGRGAPFGALSVEGHGTSEVPLSMLPIRLQTPSVRPSAG